MAEVAKVKATECPVCLDDYRDPTHVISEKQIGIACSTCQRKAPVEDLFRCESCRANFLIDNDQDAVLCGVWATKHLMAFKAHELLEHRVASKRDIYKSMRRIDQERPVYRTFVISSKAEGMEHLATKANEVARKCEAKSEEVRDGIRAMNNLTRDELELMTSRALRLKDVSMDSQNPIRPKDQLMPIMYRVRRQILLHRILAPSVAQLLKGRSQAKKPGVPTTGLNKASSELNIPLRMLFVMLKISI
ncbi:hypothetical protein AAVH_09672 [Aphelenchoides avenae]|nr:hypothetical protein AAVH_09672 [Aphelenchus avenae]